MPDVFDCLNKDDDDDDDNDDDDDEGVFIWGDLSQDYWCKITWVMLHQRNRWNYNQNGFIGSFDAPWHDLSDPGSLMLIQFTPKECTPKAGLHRQFLSQELIDAIFVSLKLQLQNRMCKPGVNFSVICRCDIAGVWKCLKLDATKIALSCHDKNHRCKQTSPPHFLPPHSRPGQPPSPSRGFPDRS